MKMKRSSSSNRASPKRSKSPRRCGSRKTRTSPKCQRSPCHCSPQPCSDFCPDAPECYNSVSGIRGYRPGDYFTRGTSIGGETRVGCASAITADLRPTEGFNGWRRRECCSACPTVPRILGCSQEPTTSRTVLRSPHVSKLELDLEDPSAPCQCSTQVETKPVMSDAFTMTQCCTRDQGVVARVRTAEKAIEASLVTREIATDTEDLSELFPHASSNGLVKIVPSF